MIDDNAVVTVSGAAVPESSSGKTEPPEDPITLAEHDETEPFSLSEPDQNFLESLSEKSRPLSVTYTADGTASISSSSYVGVMTLPSGTTVEVTPKETVSNLLYLLQYAFDVPASTIEQTTGLKPSETFIDAFGALFHAELNEVLRQGIRRDYKRVQTLEQEVRGRLDVQRQIQRPTTVPTDFAVEYDAFTSDTVLNRAIHRATQIVTSLVEDEHLSSKLSHQEKKLQQFVSPTHVSLEELNTIEITRLNAYYEDLLELTRLVLSRLFFEDLSYGDRQSFGLFINMNSIFEKAAERAFREAARDISSEWRVEGQANIRNIISGPHAVTMKPDFVVSDSSGSVFFVGDAKWKTGSLQSGDVHQITSYILSEKASGILVYPQQGGRKEPSRVHDGMNDWSLQSVELPTATDAKSYYEYRDRLIETASEILFEHRR
ncbi:hypothetical protein [Natrialba sp. INN-245]|uniref:McrC family protein n=1 Tax=Natrialba sp. INN-245 TaxID=2690967 RepID=UPI001310BB5A|nr:hypothetical protein [Natrialba sp. INN-245]MWV38873.1 hypothetical protein [Natrialba sp. INN-245]